jgi:hypothetical protein
MSDQEGAGLPAAYRTSLQALGLDQEAVAARNKLIADNAQKLAQQAEEEIEKEALYYRRYATTILLNTLNQSMWVNIDTIPTFWIRFMSVLGMGVYTGILLYYGIRSFQNGQEQTFFASDKRQGQCSVIPRKTDVTVNAALIVDATSGELSKGLSLCPSRQSIRYAQ